MQRKGMAVAMAVLAALPIVARAQKPVTQTETAELTATIDAIDHDARMVTLKDKDGLSQSLYCGPEVKRFNELKVGDKVTFRYYQSLAYQIRKPGQAPTTPPNTTPTITYSKGRPGATVSQQQTASVTLMAIDPTVPSVTVQTEDGHTASFRVEDKKNLEGVKVGDKVEITYTQAFVVSVK